ncbi:MAG: hypothetical protein JWO90_2563 [Solirubrobacterales bacterium]|jgi:hypothetical protein|nr:hypothetical protein [Solirubrobacterales bacterium]
MIRRFPVRLEIVTPGPRAESLVDAVAGLLGAERLPSLPGEVCISVAGLGLRDAARRAERMLAGQGFGWSAHVRVADAGPLDPGRRITAPHPAAAHVVGHVERRPRVS